MKSPRFDRGIAAARHLIPRKRSKSLAQRNTHVSRILLLGKRSCSAGVLSLLFLAAGCVNNEKPASTPSIIIAPDVIVFPATNQGSTTGPTAVTVTNSSAGALSISSVAFGGTNPADFVNTNSCTGSIPSMGHCTISVTFAPARANGGPLSETITLTDNASSSPQIVNVSGTANVVSLSVTPHASALSVSGTLSFLAAGDSAGVVWSVRGVPFLGSPGTVASPGTIDADGNYSGPGSGQSFYATVIATSVTNPAISAQATINVVSPGVFTGTNNAQVAQYAVTPPSPANVSVQFGPTATYGLNTWTQPNSQLGSPVSLYVAGMKQSTPYHMRGLLRFGDGTSFDDADYIFTTGALTAGQAPNMTFTTTPGMTPQSGVEMLDLVDGAVSVSPLVVTDLSGNILWSYNPGFAGLQANPIKLLTNGHFLINFSSTAADGLDSVLQEIDLGGNLIWQMTAAEFNTALATATCNECDVTVSGTHHDFAVLPNGHIVVIAATQQVVSGTTVTGDVIIDLGDMENVSGGNPTHTPQPVWAWNEFNHLDVARQPYMYPDWTHTNAILYSSSDGNLIISMRHQNWLVKIEYDNGAGAGGIVWHLGYQGDFSLLNADGTPDTNVTDWFFAQHGPTFTSTNTSGNFSLALFDNGDDRGVAVVTGGTCGVIGQPDCYSTAPILRLDETALTATLAFNPTTVNYSWFGGNTETLANGDVEYDESGTTALPAANAAIYEVTQSSTPQTVWHVIIAGQYAYRGFRMPSLYPGVQW